MLSLDIPYLTIIPQISSCLLSDIILFYLDSDFLKASIFHSFSFFKKNSGSTKRTTSINSYTPRLVNCITYRQYSLLKSRKRRKLPLQGMERGSSEPSLAVESSTTDGGKTVP